MNQELKITLDRKDRQKYIDELLAYDGLSHIRENPDAAYCPISLTQTPEAIKPFVLRRQKILGDVLNQAGIIAYDPSTAPFSPDTNLTSLPQEIYLVDSGKIVGARFFVGHNLMASTGFGVESEKATKLNRIAVILQDSRIRISRMQPDRTIYLQYSNFEEQASQFVKVFEMLTHYDPGMGLVGSEPVLVGFKKETGEAVNLEALVYETFPDLKFHYDGQQPTLRMDVVNPGLFYESASAK